MGTLEDHTASCQFALVPCPNKCAKDKGAGKLLLIRKHLEEHLKTKCPNRAHKCSHCGKKGTFTSITEDHDKVCENKIVTCPNKESGCSLSMERGKAEEHVSKDCGYTEVACVYESLRCGVKMLRKDREIHENEDREKHLDLSLATVRLLTEQLKTLTEHHEKDSKQHEGNLKRLMETVKLKDEQLLQTLTEKNDTLYENHKKELKQHEGNLKRLTEAVRLQDEQLKTLTEKNETLSEGEAVIVKLPGYANKKEKKELFLSPPFYTHPGGYKMCVSVCANGIGGGKGTHVSVFVKLLEGHHDNQIHWPFIGTGKFELLNQLGDYNHQRKVFWLHAEHNIKVGSNGGLKKFLPHSSLGHNPATNTQYLLNDTLYFRVSVKADDHKPWLDCIDKVSVVAMIENDSDWEESDEEEYSDEEDFSHRMCALDRAHQNWR